MADKYLKQSSGNIAEQEALVTSAGAGDAGKIPALDAAGRLSSTLMPVGIGADTKLIQASENLAAGDYVNIHDVGGAFRARKADGATTGKHAHGFVLAGVSSGANATIYFEGPNTQVSGQAPGDVYLSDTTPGLGQATAPAGAGKIVQKLGVAVGATEVNFEAQQPIILA